MSIAFVKHYKKYPCTSSFPLFLYHKSYFTGPFLEFLKRKKIRIFFIDFLFQETERTLEYGIRKDNLNTTAEISIRVQNDDDQMIMPQESTWSNQTRDMDRSENR